MIDHNHSPHQWTQASPFTPPWLTPSTTAFPQPNHIDTPNPFLLKNATLPVCTPLELEKTGPRTVLVTVSLPTEIIFTLPSKALEIKMIRKNLKITQCRFFNSPPRVRGIPHDTSKLFLGGFVRKDLQYSEATRQTATTVEGTIKDFVIEVPFTCVVDLDGIHASPTHFSQRQEYEFSSSKSLPLGFSPKDKLMSGDLTEFNVLSQESLNSLPSCELVFSQINEMDDALDRVPLEGGPFEEGIFRTVQEKMIVLIQLRLTFPTEIDPPHPHCRCHECRSNDPTPSKVCCPDHSFFSATKLLKFLQRGIFG